MIAYDLQCANGHRFEGWFDSSEAFDHQNARQLIACPICDNAVISKVPSPFAIRMSSGNSSVPSPEKAELTELERQIGQFVENHFENVGADFASEALKIHYGVSEPRNIRGVSTPHEEAMLTSEGIKFLKIPISDKNSNGDPDLP